MYRMSQIISSYARIFKFNFVFPGFLIVFKFNLLVKSHENEVFLLFDSLQYLNTFFCEM